MAKFSRLIISDASGAQQAARDGMLVMIVDVIDMSTTLESALDAGAYAVLGCSPDFTRAPVRTSPERIGQAACRLARESAGGIIIVAEPRVGPDEERIAHCQKVIRQIEKEKGLIEAVIPNLGAETPKIMEMKNKVIVAVTDTGGVAYDAAYVESDRVITGTIARTLSQKGLEPALSAVSRIKANIKETDKGIAIVAASKNSIEDVLAAQFIYNLMGADLQI